MEVNKRIMESIRKGSSKVKDEEELYRYSGLVQAIEFFSQRFSMEEIMDYIFEFIYDLIHTDKIAMLIRDEENHLKPYQMIGYEEEIVLKGENMDEIVYFHPGILEKEVLAKYFDIEKLLRYDSDMVLQIVMDKQLYGLIFMKREGSGYSQDDRIIANALMNLFYTSLTNYKAYEELERIRKQLDEKVFNLFAINYSSKALLSELDMDKLYELSISVFSELTQSRITGMFVFDEQSENYRLVKMLDVFHPEKKFGFTLYPKNKKTYNRKSSVIDCSNEEEYTWFMNQFENPMDSLSRLEPVYIIMIHSEHNLLAIITLGKKVNETYDYKESEFELIESIVSSMYMAMSNAARLKEVMETQDLVRKQLNYIMQLNSMMENLNSVNSQEGLIHLLLSTLKVSFGFKKVIFANCRSLDSEEEYSFYYENSEYRLDTITNVHLILPDRIEDKETLFLYTSEEVEALMGLIHIDNQEKSHRDFLPSKMILVPLTIELENPQLIGFVAAWDVEDGRLFDHKNVFALESIAHHVAPVLYQLKTKEQIRRNYEKNYHRLFQKVMEREIKEAEEFKLSLYVLHIFCEKKFSFEPIKDQVFLSSEFKVGQNLFPVDYQNIFLLADELSAFEYIALDSELKKEMYSYKDDFRDLEEFKRLIQG